MDRYHMEYRASMRSVSIVMTDLMTDIELCIMGERLYIILFDGLEEFVWEFVDITRAFEFFAWLATKYKHANGIGFYLACHATADYYEDLSDYYEDLYYDDLYYDELD